MLKRQIRGDLDRVYDDSSAECIKITSLVCSNNGSNKFCNLEILKKDKMYYFVLTSGRIGDESNTIYVRRLNSDVVVTQCYIDECKKRISEGYVELGVISIYPNCTAAGKDFVYEKKVPSKSEVLEVSKHTDKEKSAPIQKKVSTFVLDPAVKSFVQTIYLEVNESLKRYLDPESFKTTSNPLGLLSLDTIQHGRYCLGEISKLQNKQNSLKRKQQKYEDMLITLYNEYNSTIPRVIPRGSDAWLLNTGERVLSQYDFLDLLELSLSNAVLQSSYVSDLETKYKALNSEISVITDTEIIEAIKRKMQGEQLHNHHMRARVLNVFSVNQKNAPVFDSSAGNVVSLFHGTRCSNLVGILSTSLKLPHNLGPNVPITGSMFGAGVYFGEYSKALQYSAARFSSQKNKTNKAYLFLCDVSLGKIKMETSPKNYAQAPSGFTSVMGVGEDSFHGGCNIRGINGTHDLHIPKEVFQKNFRSCSSSLMHDEFILYNQNRYTIRYIVEVERL